MKYLSLILTIMVVAACQQAPRPSAQNDSVVSASGNGSFGNKFTVENAIPATQLAGVFSGSDTVTITISGNISASCKHSGCWMDLDMDNGETVHVTFYDESFTIPLDAAGKHAIAEGSAIRELIPAESLRNYAREEGKSEEEVAAITESVYAYEFIAIGVLIEE